MKTAFVILHYLAGDETAACLESVLQLESSGELVIVVVDNHSGNGSLESLQSQFGNHPVIHWIELPENSGFARGNNAGYTYAKHTLGADFIILINNDTLIPQRDFLTQIETIYDQNRFDILGPDIVTLDKQHQNPKAAKGLSKADVEQKIRLIRRNLWLNRCGLYEILVLADRLKRGVRSVERTADSQTNSTTPIESPSSPSQIDRAQRVTPKPAVDNVVLHGSCLILSPDYVRRYKGLFSQTFLYGEEDILWQIAQDEQLRLVYDPRIWILHKEDQSTALLKRSSRKRRQFKFTHELHSFQMLQAIQNDPATYRQDLLESEADHSC